MKLRLAAIAALTATLCVETHAQSRDVSESGLVGSGKPVVDFPDLRGSTSRPATFVSNGNAGPSGERDPDTSTPIAPAPVRAALHAAWRQHPAYRATEALLAAARARHEAAGQPLYNPELEVAADDEGTDRTATIGLNLKLDIHGKRDVRRDAAAARVDQATAEARLRRLDFAKRWLVSWTELRTAQQRVATGEERLALTTRIAELAERRYAADDISGLERDFAMLARAEAQAQQSRLVADRAGAEARFRAVGGSLERMIALALPTDTLPAPAVGPDTDLRQLPEWQVAHAASIASDREIVVARRNRLADPSIGIHGGRIDYGPIKDNVFGVSVSIPLFVRNSYGAEVVAAQAEADFANAEAERIRAELGAERRGAIDSYAAARLAWSRWQASPGTDVARRADLLERLWREGELSTTDYLQQIDQTLDTTQAGAELEARTWRTWINYLASTGQLERWANLEATP